jgi:DNA-binding NarL/FixJ family response regulator
MRVVLVAGSAPAAEAIRRQLRHAPRLRVIGFVDARRSCGTAVAKASPDLVLIDEMSPPEAALACIRQVRVASPTTRIVLLASRMGSAWLGEAREAGINAAVAKSVHPASLGTVIGQVAAGNVYHAFETAPAPRAALVPDRPLTARESEILALVAEGASNGRIASELWVSEQTVKFHLSNVYRKLGVANRTEASYYAHTNALLERASRRSAPAATARVAA